MKVLAHGSLIIGRELGVGRRVRHIVPVGRLEFITGNDAILREYVRIKSDCNTCVLHIAPANHDDSESVRNDHSETAEIDRPVFDAFPEHLKRLVLLLDVEPEFVELCDDFDAVAIAYQRVARANGEMAAADEYHSLRLELEGEILEWLRRGGGPRAANG